MQLITHDVCPLTSLKNYYIIYVNVAQYHFYLRLRYLGDNSAFTKLIFINFLLLKPLLWGYRFVNLYVKYKKSLVCFVKRIIWNKCEMCRGWWTDNSLIFSSSSFSPFPPPPLSLSLSLSLSLIVYVCLSLPFCLFQSLPTGVCMCVCVCVYVYNTLGNFSNFVCFT